MKKFFETEGNKAVYKSFSKLNITTYMNRYLPILFDIKSLREFNVNADKYYLTAFKCKEPNCQLCCKFQIF